VTCIIIINQLVLWDPSVNYYSISQRQGSIYNPRHSASCQQLSGTLCLQLPNVPLPLPLLRRIWKLNCSLLHMTLSNISSAAGASDLNSWPTAPPINFFDIWPTWINHTWMNWTNPNIHITYKCFWPLTWPAWKNCTDPDSREHVNAVCVKVPCCIDVDLLTCGRT